LLIYFCGQIREARLPVQKTTQLSNLYEQQLKKIRKAVTALHEDLQYDYLKSIQALEY